MKGTPFEERARKYVEGALPHGTASERQKLLDDWFAKEQAVGNIYGDFTRRAGDPSGKNVLDIGFGNGIATLVFARNGARMTGLEVSPELFSIATDYLKERGVSADLRLYDGAAFPFDDETFDHIYSVSVLEHVTQPEAVLKEAYRVLKPGGTFYLAFPNRWNPKETHTGIYLLSYLPRRIAGALLALFGRNSLDDWNLHFLSYFWLRRLLKRNGIGFSVVFETDHGTAVRKILKKVLAAFGVHHSAILPHVMVVLIRS